MKIIDVPTEFTCSSNNAAFNGITLDRYAHEYFIQHSEIVSNKVYLPIHWADYLCSIQWCPGALNSIIEFCQSLPADEYWTLTQLDNGLYVNVPGCFSFGVGDDRTDIIIPLTRASYGLERNDSPSMLASFVGWSNSVERIRLKELFKGRQDFDIEVFDFTYSPEISMVDRMRNSIFALCPRGNIAQTGRLYEAMDLGCIPVYISDNFVTPFSDILNWSEFCIMVKSKDIEILPDILHAIDSETIVNMRNKVREVYDNYFSIQGLCKQITRIVGTL